MVKSKRKNDDDNSFLTVKDIAHKEKIKVALISIITSAVLTVSKLVIAILTNSLGILSEGMHSGLDVFFLAFIFEESMIPAFQYRLLYYLCC